MQLSLFNTTSNSAEEIIEKDKYNSMRIKLL